MTDIIIVGGGISGFYSAYLLTKTWPGCKIKIIEARNRIGGRLYSPGGHDMGGTWSWPSDDSLVSELIEDLDISAFDADTFQEKDAASQQIRVLGGAQQLVFGLAKAVSNHHVEVHLNEQVVGVEKKGSDSVQVRVQRENEGKETACYEARSVILALPPRLVAAKIQFQPQLPPEKLRTMLRTPTWMAGASKVFLEYSSPFWRTKGRHPLPIQTRNGAMIYDASQDKKGKYAICAFYAGKPVRVTDESVKKSLLPLLESVYGAKIQQYANLFIHNWMDEEYTCEDKERLQNENRRCMDDMFSFGDEILRKPVDKMIYFASTETENQYGHIQGALQSGQRAIEQLMQHYAS